jgi:hypothetical protein
VERLRRPARLAWLVAAVLGNILDTRLHPLFGLVIEPGASSQAPSLALPSGKTDER